MKPENVWVASVISRDEVVFDSWDGLAKEVDKDLVLNMWERGQIKTESLSMSNSQDHMNEEIRANRLKNPTIEYIELEQKQYDKAQKYIKSLMHDRHLHDACQNAWTIKRSNQIWYLQLKHAKINAYAGLDIRVRQDVIDRIDKYWSI